jgi:hypothetical protein
MLLPPLLLPPPLLLLQVPFKSMINNSCQGGSLVAAILTGNAQLLGAALDSDVIVEPVRGPLIPGMMEVKAAAKAAGGWCWWCVGVVEHDGGQRGCQGSRWGAAAEGLGICVLRGQVLARTAWFRATWEGAGQGGSKRVCACCQANTQ